LPQHRRAQASLGDRCAIGRGVQKDRSNSLEGCGRAADQGDAAPLCRHGEMDGKGQGVRQDDAQARAWRAKTAAQGHAEARKPWTSCASAARESSETFASPMRGVKMPRQWGSRELGLLPQNGRDGPLALIFAHSS